MSDIDALMAKVRQATRGRTFYEGQDPWSIRDIIFVEEIASLRERLDYIADIARILPYEDTDGDAIDVQARRILKLAAYDASKTPTAADAAGGSP